MKLPSKLKIGAIVVLLFVLFIILNLTAIAKEVKNLFYLISSPIQKSLWRVGDRVSDFFETISEIKNLKKEVDEISLIDTLRYAWLKEELKLKIQEFMAENAKLKELKKENEILRGALEIGLEKEFKLTLAEIIGKDISQDSLIINKGSADGISKGLPVITQQKILLGKINEVYKNFSKAMLISNKESSFDAKISEKDISGLVKGRGSLKLFLDRIPQEKEIKEGDLIVTTALGGIFPSGLLVGEIKEIKKSDIEPFQQAEIKPFFNITEIEKLFIILE